MSRPRMSAGRAAAVAAAGCGLILIALIFDAAPLFVPAVALVVLGVAAPAWVWLTARGVRAERHLLADRVIEDETVFTSIELRRHWPAGVGGWGAFEVTDQLTDARLELGEILAPVGAGRRANLRLSTRFARRGRHRVPGLSLTISDPLELATAWVQSTGPAQELLVLPATEPVRWLRADHNRRLRIPDGRDGAEALAAVDLDGLRPYRPGTPASRIHWPAVARGAGLIERRLQADGDTRPLVVLDARTSSAPDAIELLDAAVRAAASLAVDLARAGGCALLLPGEQRATTIDRELMAWPAAYARLAVVEDSPARPARAPSLGGVAGRTGAMIYVAVAPGERLSGLLAGTAANSTILVVPDQRLAGDRPRGVRGPVRVACTVSGCHGFLLGAGRDPHTPFPEHTMA